MLRSLTMAALVAAAAPALAQEDPTLTLVETEEYGAVLALQDGTPVYTFFTNVRGGDGEPPLDSCNEPCLQEWPLVTTSGEVQVGEGLDEQLVSTIEWEGQSVVQYASLPLFLFAGDEPGGEPRGQEVHTHGGWWYLVDAAGLPIVTGIAPDPNDPVDQAPEGSQAGG